MFLTKMDTCQIETSIFLSLFNISVDGFISSELPVLFELRVRYLLSYERVSEAMALAKCCAWHPTAGQHLFFLQVYLSWLLKTSQHDILHKEVSVLLLCFYCKTTSYLCFLCNLIAAFLGCWLEWKRCCSHNL